MVATSTSRKRAEAAGKRGRGVLARLFAPVDAASLALFRVAFGGLLVVEAGRFLFARWIPRYYLEPEFHFRYYGFGWVREWPGVGLYLHVVALGVLAGLVMVGLAYRVAAALVFVAFTYLFLLDQAQYLNHFYLVSLVAFLMTLLPAHRAGSLDARRRPGVASDVVPAWSLLLLRGQIGIVYAYAGIAKLNADWVRGEPVRTWLGEIAAARAPGSALGRALASEPMVWAVAYGGLALDLLVVPLLVWRRTRALGLGLALVFHLANAFLFQIGIFPWFMIAATTLFLAPDWPRRVLGWPRAVGRERPTRPRSAWARGAVAAGVAGWLLVQALVPLRHLLYPGSVHWTEEGHRFAWHMKLRTKDAVAYFVVRDPETGEVTRIDPARELTPRQARKMAARPDMILQYAHHLAERHRRPGGPRPEVRALVAAALNGRRLATLVDPDVDLAAQPRDLRHAEWIVPLTEPLPPRRP